MTTIDNITDEQIEALRTEAASAGDDRQVQICDAALGLEPDYSRGRACLLIEQGRARELCARAISAAEAQS